jgi:hypothetical protein
MKLFSALTAAIMLAVSVPAKADELSTYDHVVIMFAAGYCLASEGMLSVEEAGEFILKTLKKKRYRAISDCKPYKIEHLL